MNQKVTFIMSVIIIVFSGCSLSNKSVEEAVYETINTDAEEVLSLDPSANIFQFNDNIYQTGIEWVNRLTVTKKEQIGEIKKINDQDMSFENGTANKLAVSSKIYSVKERQDILIVETEGEQLKYLAIVEG